MPQAASQLSLNTALRSPRTRVDQALRKSWFFSGSARMRLPVAAKIGVAQRRRQRRHRRLADAAPEIAARHDHGLDLRHIGDAQHLVVVEIRLHGGAVLDRDLAVERRGQRVDDGALRSASRSRAD